MGGVLGPRHGALLGLGNRRAERRSAQAVAKLENAYGIGFRFNTYKAVWFRVDIGFGGEGVQTSSSSARRSSNETCAARLIFAALVAFRRLCRSAASRPGVANGPRFYRDDPIARDPETEDASGVREAELSELYDFAENSFLGAGERRRHPRGQHQHDRRGAGLELVHQPPRPRAVDGRPAGQRTRHRHGTIGTWTIVSGKMEGVAPGFTIRDGAGQLYFIKFDPPSNPEMASGAEVISTKFFHAFGYHVPENYLATIRREALVIGEGALIEDDNGRRRQMDTRDLDALLKRGARHTDGSYRVLASKALDGKPVGPFRYYGTRPDDPNDIFPHEHRRELRGLLVFCAWLNHDDSRSINSLDTLVSARQPHDRPPSPARLRIDARERHDAGAEPARRQRVRVGIAADAHHDADARLLRAPVDQGGLSRHPGARAASNPTYFRPEDWKPEYPNPAFSNARPEDRFWAARILAGLSDDGVTARSSEPRSSRDQQGHELPDRHARWRARARCSRAG